MSSFLEVISKLLYVVLGINTSVYVLRIVNVPEDLVLILRAVFYVLGAISLIVTIYYKRKNAKLEIENKKLKQKQQEDEANNVFLFRKNYSEK